MEDRSTAGLYLEMTDSLSPSEYAAKRVDEVLGASGGRPGHLVDQRATATAPTCRACSPSSTRSACTRWTTRSARPTTPDGITGHHFRRYPRPGQGRLTGKPTVGLSLVLISPTTPDQAQALRDWGDFVHISWIAAVGVPGLLDDHAVRERHRAATPGYMHFYEMDTEDAETTVQDA